MATNYRKSLLKLAENPDYDDSGDDKDENEYDEASHTMEDVDEKEDKGRTVKGPRTKLASSDRLDKMERTILSLAEGVKTLSRVQLAALNKHDDTMDEFGSDDADPLALPEEDNNRLDLARLEKSMREAISKGIADGIAAASAATSKVSKDDAASAWDEKDSDVPGNRPYDQTVTPEDATVIQGGPSAGPGPISKSSDMANIEAVLSKMLDDRGFVNKSTGPGIGATDYVEGKLDKGDTFDFAKMQKEATKKSFKEIAQIRAELGDLPTGIL